MVFYVHRICFIRGFVARRCILCCFVSKRRLVGSLLRIDKRVVPGGFPCFCIVIVDLPTTGVVYRFPCGISLFRLFLVSDTFLIDPFVGIFMLTRKIFHRPIAILGGSKHRRVPTIFAGFQIVIEHSPTGSIFLHHPARGQINRRARRDVFERFTQVFVLVFSFSPGRYFRSTLRV